MLTPWGILAMVLYYKKIAVNSTWTLYMSLIGFFLYFTETVDLYNKDVVEAKIWFEEKKMGLNTGSDLAHGTCDSNSAVVQPVSNFTSEYMCKPAILLLSFTVNMLFFVFLFLYLFFFWSYHCYLLFMLIKYISKYDTLDSGDYSFVFYFPLKWKAVGSSAKWSPYSFWCSWILLIQILSEFGPHVDMSKSRMNVCPPWTCPAQHTELRTPSIMVMELFKEGTLNSRGNDYLSSKALSDCFFLNICIFCIFFFIKLDLSSMSLPM